MAISRFIYKDGEVFHEPIQDVRLKRNTEGTMYYEFTPEERTNRRAVLTGVLDRVNTILQNDSGISIGTEALLHEIIEMVGAELAD